MSDSDRNLLLEYQETITRVDLEWNNVEVIYKSKTSEKRILKSVSGFAKSGEFLVIMGTSGAGKTTLLNLISGAVKNTASLTSSGTIQANRQSIYDINYQKYCGYVTQEDILLDMLTVKETIMFAAKLKLKAPYDYKVAKVNSIMEELNLIKCQNTIIGGPAVKGVSGGEKKRVCIATELITTPSVLFLDEPTSGLDSFTSFQVIELLNAQAAKGRAVVSTIHQPSSDIFNIFDKLLLLCDGHVMFHGNARDSVNYFTELGYPCPTLSNPADYYMEILHIENLDEKTEDEEKRVDGLKDAFLANRKPMSESHFNYDKLETGTRGYASSYPVQIYHCTVRAVIMAIRNSKLTIFKVLIMVFVAIQLDILFYDVGSRENYTDAINRIGALFYVLVTLIYANLNSTILTFPLLREVFLKESRAKMYGTTAFFFAKNFADLLIEIFASILFQVCLYWFIGFNNSVDRVFNFMFISILCHMAGTSLGLSAGAWFTRVDVAASIGAISVLPFYYFSGFLRPLDDIPVGVRWIAYISPLRFSYDSFMKNEFQGTKYNETAYGQYDIHGSIGESVLYLAIVMIGFRIFAFVGLKINSRIS